jgi:hypothetical protein
MEIKIINIDTQEVEFIKNSQYNTSKYPSGIYINKEMEGNRLDDFHNDVFLEAFKFAKRKDK